MALYPDQTSTVDRFPSTLALTRGVEALQAAAAAALVEQLT
jgi:hypothetical protein